MKTKSSQQLVALLFAIIIGALLGGFLPSLGERLSVVGELFLRALLMLVVPLVMTSLITAVSSVGEAKQLGKIGRLTLTYFFSTTAIAVMIGILVVIAIKPGYAKHEVDRVALRGGQFLPTLEYQIQDRTLQVQGEEIKREYGDRFWLQLQDHPQIYGAIESTSEDRTQLTVTEWITADQQIVQPPSQGTGVVIDLAQTNSDLQAKNRSIGSVFEELLLSFVPKNLFHSMANNEVLPLISFSIVLGLTLLLLGEKTAPLSRGFEMLNLSIMAIVHGLMHLAPYGIAALVAGRIGHAGGFAGFLPELILLGKYALAVILGLTIHGGIILPLLLKLFSPYSLQRFLPNMFESLTTAFATSSSSATLPITLECITEKSHLKDNQSLPINGLIPARIASFVLSLGATINMDGTALYESVAAIFIAQVYGISLSLTQILIIFVTSTLAAIGAAGIPEAGLVTMVIVLKSANLPIEGISLILVIDWFLDRCRTMVNVWGDSIGTAIIASHTTAIKSLSDKRISSSPIPNPVIKMPPPAKH